MTDLIEAIARGIRATGHGFWKVHSTAIGDPYEDLARAALLAIEQSGTHVVAGIMPTPDMVEAGMEAMVRDLGDSVNAPPSYIVWRAMLSARPKVTT